MATEKTIRENGRDIRVVEDTKLTVESVFKGTDGTTNRGTVRTVIQTNAISENPTVQISTDYRAGAPTDGVMCDELIQYADDMIGHWMAVKEQLTAVAEGFHPQP